MKTLPERIDEIMAPFGPLINLINTSNNEPLQINSKVLVDMFDNMKILLVQHIAGLQDEIWNAKNTGYLEGAERAIRAMNSK